MKILVTGSEGFSDANLVYVTLRGIFTLAGGQEIIIARDQSHGVGEISRGICEANAQYGLVDELDTAYTLRGGAVEFADDLDSVFGFFQQGLAGDRASYVIRQAEAAGMPTLVQYDSLAPRARD